MLLATVAGCGRASVAPATTRSVQEQLGPLVSSAFQNEVLVFGTLHLSAFEQLTPAHLRSTLEALARFRPTRIGVEVLSADEVAMLEEYSAHDSAAAAILDMFGKRIVSLGEAARVETGTNRIEARATAHELMKRASGLSVAERSQLILLMLAAYEYPSALLQWSYLPPSERADSSWPAEIRSELNQALASNNEVSTVALALARELGLQRLHAIDSQYDGARTMAMPRAALEDLFSHPSRGAWRNLEMTAQDETRRERALAGNDLLPYFTWLNSREYMSHDVRQWEWLFETRHESGLDRFRYAMWELRNQRIATNIIDAAASVRPERLLVIIGNAHKPYLDTALSDTLTIRARQFEELVESESENRD